MKEAVEVHCELREPGSSNMARRLRREGKLPAVLYGGERPARPLVVDPRQIVQILRSDQGENTILALTVGEGQQQTALIQDYQVDPVTQKILHADFIRISMDVEVEVQVPVHLIGEPIGVRRDRGVLDQVIREVTVVCLPGNIPDSFDVDVSGLEVGGAIHVSDLQVPEGVAVQEEGAHTVAVVAVPEEIVEPAAEEEALLGEPAEPELIRPERDEDQDNE